MTLMFILSLGLHNIYTVIILTHCFHLDSRIIVVCSYLTLTIYAFDLWFDTQYIYLVHKMPMSARYHIL
jgi:hypothetical protein